MEEIIREAILINKKSSKIFYPILALLTIVGFYIVFTIDIATSDREAYGQLVTFLMGASSIIRMEMEDGNIKEHIINYISKTTDYEKLNYHQLKKENKIYNIETGISRDGELEVNIVEEVKYRVEED